jgi:uncharacterized repeat protein (TIGR03803 family)
MRNRTHSHAGGLRGMLPIAAVAGVIMAAAPFSECVAAVTTVYSFCSTSSCADGQMPVAGLLMDAAGDLYGTTENGGKYASGAVFKLVPNADKSAYTEHILKNFCVQVSCPGGQAPEGDLIMDVDGNLYGTTYGGGKHFGGVVFKLTHGANGWGLRVIHEFCAKSNCKDGGAPATGLAYAGQASGALWNEISPLFGTALYGGTHGKGIAYELAPGSAGWSFTVIHNFNAPAPVQTIIPSPLLVDPAGNLIGVTGNGGTLDEGELYKLAAGTWQKTTLHNFCSEANCAGGSVGWGRVAMDAAGNLFGVTAYGGGGSSCTVNVGCGAAFEWTTSGEFDVIHAFCSQASCKDGGVPMAGVTIDANGNLFGTTSVGGLTGGGSVFELTHGTTWTGRGLYDFCHKTNCTDGDTPYASVVLDGSGNIYGTTSAGGANGNGGTVFELTP